MSNTLRISGLATGLDTDTMVKQMMQPYQMKVDKLKQDKQVVQWKQELYREIMTDINNFKSSYFDILKGENYMLSKNNYAGFDTATSNIVAGEQAGVSISASTGAVSGSYRVQVVKMAENAKIEGQSLSESSSAFNLANWHGGTVSKTININVGGTDTSIVLNRDFASKADLINEINAKISADTNLAGKLSVSDGSSGGIKFNTMTSTSIKILDATDVSELSDIKGKVINPQKYTTTISELGIAAGSFDLKYKDTSGVQQTKTISITDPDTATIQSLIDKVSKETSSNVSLSFSELTGKFSLQSLQTGSTASLEAVDGNGILSKLRVTTLTDTGADAEVKITPPGGSETTVIKLGNSFSIDGINYTLTKAGTTNTVTVTTNTQKTYDKIKSFIDKYNEIVDKVSKKIEEKKQYSFQPLTDEQKKDMEEEDIKKWEEKAKEGLLKNDSMLQNMMTSIRGAFYEGVEGAGITLSEIGLSTSADISMRGKIIVDETKLKSAIQNRGEQLANIFTKTSTAHPSYDPDLTVNQRKVRSSESGIFQRINDIFLDYTRTTRNDAGKKGLLLEKAGIKGDYTEFKNLLSDDIQKREDKINEMLDKLADKENKYYQQFAKLEKAMNNMNSQSSWLAQQLGGGGQG